jgi:hypothetical protein
MSEIRNATLLIRDRKVSGGALPSGALMAEPFINLFDGVLRFSGVTGGVYEPSNSLSVFEVGSTLYNSKITNRLNINDTFIISGDTGLVSTYGGASGAGLVGKFLSGTTSGFVLGNISDISGVSDITRVAGGTNISTGGTENNPIINLDADIILTSVNATTLSGGTIYSGSTDVETIIRNIAGVHTIVGAGSNVSVGGTTSNPIVNIVDSPSFNDVTYSGTSIGGSSIATNVSGTTFYSGSTDLETIITNISGVHTTVGAGTNTTIGGTTSNPTVNVVAAPTFTGIVSAAGFTDSTLTSGRVTYAGVGGRLTDEAGFEYDATADLLKTANVQIGIPGATGTTATIYGDLLVIGEGVSGFTSELYIEDNLIELNFNPTASTISTSIGAGWSIQDGSGVDGTDVLFDIRGTATGVANRSFSTNLGNIRVGETGTVSSPNGLFLIKDTDVIDGGSY